jgi:CLASP N terminal
MYQTPNRHRGGNSSNKNSKSTNSNSPSKVPTIADGPIHDLCTIIENTPSDDWLKRITAFEAVVEQIPALGSTYLHHPAWYNTPKVLLHLSLPIQELIKDPRSTVVRRVCVALTTLFQRCQSDARLLFKDMMHTVLIVQGQTVQTIRNAVTTMIVDAIPQVPCKSVMPFWMERLKDKSPTIRDACSLYLGVALQSWSSLEQEQYLTDEIWYQVGTALMKTLRDPSPNVRQQTKTTLMYMQQQYPIRWETLIHDPNGPAAKDTKLLQWLTSLSGGNGDDAIIPDDLSFASKYTYNSESRFAAATTTTTNNSRNATTSTTMNNPIRISSPRLLKLQTHRLAKDGMDDSSSMGGGGRSSLIQQAPQRMNQNSIPFSIAVTTTTSSAVSSTQRNTSSSKNNIPPPDPPETKGHLRRTNQNTSTTNDTTATAAPLPSTPGRNSGTPPRPKANSGIHHHKTPLPTTPQAQTYSALALQASQEEEEDDDDEAANQNAIEDTNFEYSESQNSSSHNDALVVPTMVTSPAVSLPDSPFIASMHELKKHASQRRSRNSIVMKERFKQQQLQLQHRTITPTSSRDSTTVETQKSEMENQQRHGNKEETKTVSSKVSSSLATTTTPQPKVSQDNTITTTNNSNTTPSSATQPPPEHIVIAIRLLRAHKSHVDQIMETLKLEMDTLRDFDRLLELPGRPTEEELITYYESIDLCLQQRYNANMTLRKEMNQLSTGGGTE